MASNQEPGVRTADASALIGVLRARYPDRFTPEDIEKIGQDLERALDAAAALRAVPLANGDEPAPVFQPVRGEG